jgi:hypothetical protein
LRDGQLFEIRVSLIRNRTQARLSFARHGCAW